MKSKTFFIFILPLIFVTTGVYIADSQNIVDDPLLRMPGTQPLQGAILQAPDTCITCHGERPTNNEGFIVAPGFSWSGGMMAQAARDPMLWACLTSSAQDSTFVLGNPNAVDICLRCHFPEGWLGGRSGHANNDELNGSGMIGSDFDGVSCDHCHRMYDPFFQTTFDGAREGNDWINYWDEAGNTGPGSGTASQNGADATLVEDQTLATAISFFNGNDFYLGNVPDPGTYTENALAQYFVSTGNGFFATKRANFADTHPDHTVLYSRYHKSKFFCSTCHDVSNPVLANSDFAATIPGDGTTILPTEEQPAHSYFHVERTFSEFMLSAYGQQGGAPGVGLFAPAVFETSLPNNYIARCQDCHMPDVRGKGCEETAAPLRPDESTEHPNSGAPYHDQQGGNLWMTRILASLDDHFLATFDETNFDLLVTQSNGPLTVDMNAGITPLDNGDALLAASDRAAQQLQKAGTIENLDYNSVSGELSFRIRNNTGHKLITGFLEGRRMIANIKAYQGGGLIYEVNPYSDTAGTLKGLDPTKVPSSPPLGPNEAYVDDLVYEVTPKSDLEGVFADPVRESTKTFHFVLATDRYKDNRIPPKGFDRATATTRLSEPVWKGKRGCQGDFDSDGDVDGTDLAVFSADFGRTDCGIPTTCPGDFNNDGDVDGSDLAAFSPDFGNTDCTLGPIFTPAENSGGYDDVNLTNVRDIRFGPSTGPFPAGADRVEVVLYYQGTSREYIEFLRDEINGSATGTNFLTLLPAAYIAQTDPFYQDLKAWGNTIWELWEHNHGLDGSTASVPGIVPFEMTQAMVP